MREKSWTLTYRKNSSNKYFYDMRSGKVLVALTSSAFSLPSRSLQSTLIYTIKGGAIRGLTT